MTISQMMQRLEERIEQARPNPGSAEDDEFLRFLSAFFKSSPSGVSLSPFVTEFLRPTQVATLERIAKGLEQALQHEQVALVRHLSSEVVPVLQAPAGSAPAASNERSSGYVDTRTYWYGFRVYLSHACLGDLHSAGSGAADVLKNSGVAFWIAPLVSAIVGAITGYDHGSGATVYFVWPATLIWIRSGNQL